MYVWREGPRSVIERMDWERERERGKDADGKAATQTVAERLFLEREKRRIRGSRGGRRRLGYGNEGAPVGPQTPSLVRAERGGPVGRVSSAGPGRFGATEVPWPLGGHSSVVSAAEVHREGAVYILRGTAAPRRLAWRGTSYRGHAGGGHHWMEGAARVPFQRWSRISTLGQRYRRRAP